MLSIDLSCLNTRRHRGIQGTWVLVEKPIVLWVLWHPLASRPCPSKRKFIKTKNLFQKVELVFPVTGSVNLWKNLEAHLSYGKLFEVLEISFKSWKGLSSLWKVCQDQETVLVVLVDTILDGMRWQFSKWSHTADQTIPRISYGAKNTIYSRRIFLLIGHTSILCTCFPGMRYVICIYTVSFLNPSFLRIMIW